MRRRDCKRSAIKEFMVQHTEGDAIFCNIRPACLVPLDVSCIQSELNPAKPYIETTNRTPLFICCQHLLTKP